MTSRMNRWFTFLGIPALVVLGTLLLLGLRPNETVGYFETIPEVKQMGDAAHVKPLRVNGWIQEGSITHEGAKTVFILVEKPGDGDVGDNLRVVYSGPEPLPDSF